MGTSEEIRREIPKFELPEVSFTPTRMPAPPQVVNEPKMFVTRPQIAEDSTETINEADKIKQMLKTGAIGNDPRKIKEMMMKLKESKTEKVQAKPETTPTLKTWKPEPLPVLKTWKPSPYQPKNEINFDDDDEDYDRIMRMKLIPVLLVHLELIHQKQEKEYNHHQVTLENLLKIILVEISGDQNPKMKQPKKPLKFLENIPPLQVIPMKKKIRKMKKSLVILQQNLYQVQKKHPLEHLPHHHLHFLISIKRNMDQEKV